MLKLKEIRQFVSGLGIAPDSNVYMGKLDNKEPRSIGVYNKPGEGPPVTALGGYENASYGTKKISLLVHWNRSVTESEEAAYALFEKLKTEESQMLGDTRLLYILLQVPEPVDIGTDADGVYEYVIWADFIYERNGD